jgi:colicin import membrane protein
MAEQKESSVLFSLKELMNLEEDRIRQEEAERQRVVQAEQSARADQERRTRDAEEARIRQEDERRRAEESRQREETARLEAIRHAEVERARLDAENAARMESMRRHQEHERQLTAIKESKGKKQAVFIAVAAAVFLVVGGIGGGYAFYQKSQSADAERARHEKEIGEQRAQVEKLQRELSDQSQAVSQLEDAVKNAKDEAAKQDAQKALIAAQQRQAATRQALGRVNTTSTPASKPINKPACNCQPGDPLCSCIQ